MTALAPDRPALATDVAALRTSLRLDAALCAAVGLGGALAAPAVAGLLGPDVGTGAVRLVGVAVLLWALDAALLSRASGGLLRGTVVVAASGNAAWVAGTVLLVGLGAFSTGGALLALAVAALAAALGLLQRRALRTAS